MYDAAIAGSLASATLCSQAAEPIGAVPVAGRLPASLGRPPVSPAPQAAVCRRGWRRLLDNLLSLVSGPTLERSHRGASHI
jgi:hypothetical protein